MANYNAQFIRSAADESGFITSDKPMICVSGKSNVGKSSFINMLANRKKLAKTSNTPGRTRLVNYFDFGDFILADLPGYGYAQVSKTEKERWGKTLERFFEVAPICLVIALVDIRHDPTDDDKTMIKYLYAKRLPFILVATKSDKLPKTKIKPQAATVASKLGLSAGDVIALSSMSGAGRESVEKEIEKAVNIFNTKDSDQGITDENG
ncbi:MAG: YihA family ribosome biogenesis GTP-binding protein [Clostridia bacterium]|nr:YihA family ribosome biogenesis GTP-binding protein [Clostridia bacterium]